MQIHAYNFIVFCVFIDVCPHSWKHFNGGCYFLTKNLNNWNNIKEECEQEGASLASSLDRGILSNKFSATSLWIGIKISKAGIHSK